METFLLVVLLFVVVGLVLNLHSFNEERQMMYDRLHRLDAENENLTRELRKQYAEGMRDLI